MSAKVQDSDRERDWARAAALCEESTITPGMLVKEFAAVREAAYAAGVAAERAECDEAVQSVPTPPEWRDMIGDWRAQAFNAGLIAASDAIRSRASQEGGSDE